MDIIKDLKIIYKKASVETISRIKRNPIVLLLPLFYSLLLGISQNILTMFLGRVMGSMIIGFLIPIVLSLILSSYFELLSDLNFYNRLGFKYFANTFTKNARSIYSVYFIFILIGWMINIVGRDFRLVILINIIIFFLLNSIGESIYIKGKEYTGAFSYTFEFTKENFIQWTLPLLGYLLLVFIVLRSSGVITLINNDVITITTGYPLSVYELSEFTLLIPIVIVQIITAVYTVFRGALYQILSTSTIRKRLYMGEL